MTPSRFSDLLDLRPAVRSALDRNDPVVALESTVLTHGIPRPDNLELGRGLEEEVRLGGAVPATIAVREGRFVVGLEPDELERLCQDPAVRKLNVRDLAPAAGLGWTGGTTVSATMALAAAAGIRVFATGGIGGVHRGNVSDVSADLPELARTPVAVVCSGAKAILDLPRTLEVLETNGVPVIGWRTDRFPEFFCTGGDLPVSGRADTAGQTAEMIRVQLELGRGLLICVPCPEGFAVPRDVFDSALAAAEGEARRARVEGKDLTPFLLERLVEATGGATLDANRALLLNNARIAAEIASALSG